MLDQARVPELQSNHSVKELKELKELKEKLPQLIKEAEAREKHAEELREKHNLWRRNMELVISIKSHINDYIAMDDKPTLAKPEKYVLKEFLLERIKDLADALHPEVEIPESENW